MDETTPPDAQDESAATPPPASGGPPDTATGGGPDSRSAGGRVTHGAASQRSTGGTPSMAQTEGARARRPRRPAAPGGNSAVIPVLVALIGTIVMQQLLNTTVPADSYFYRLFRPDGGWVMSLVPGLIAFVFIWTLTDLALKLRVALGNERDIERSEVKQLPAMVAHEPSQVTLRRLRSWDRALLARHVGRRMLWLLRHLDTVDAQRAHELVRHQSDLDADSAASGYRAVRLFVWAMPILGFIGTVLGISLAVGGFSEFLTTNVSIDEIDAVTSELGEVASGLSFAFDTTLLGLLAGLVANVAASTVQGREERFITGLEELGLRIMAEAPSEREPAEPEAVVDESREQIDKMVRAHLDELSEEMDQFTYTVRRGLQSLNEASARISRGMESSIESVNETMEGLGEHVRGTTDRLGRNMEAIEEANRRLATTLSSLAPVLEQLAGPMEVRLMPKVITPPAASGGGSAPGGSGPADGAGASGSGGAPSGSGGAPSGSGGGA